MAMRRASHNVALLDALDLLPETSFDGEFWRVVHGYRSPVDGSKGSGRWNRQESEVLYCALEKDGALSEINFHIRRAQSVFPSRLISFAHRMSATFTKVMDLSDLAALQRLGVDPARYQEMLYEKSQEIGEAVGFLGFEAMLVPNARHPSTNLVIFPANCDLDSATSIERVQVDWAKWQRERLAKAKDIPHYPTP
jgi:RES domain-containing protein